MTTPSLHNTQTSTVFEIVKCHSEPDSFEPRPNLGSVNGWPCSRVFEHKVDVVPNLIVNLEGSLGEK